MEETFYYGFPTGHVDYKFYDLHYKKGKELYKNKQYDDAVFHLRRSMCYYDWAKSCLAYCYNHGLGVERNPLTALTLYKSLMFRTRESQWIKDEMEKIETELNITKKNFKEDEVALFDKELGNIKVKFSAYINNPIVRFCKDYISVTVGSDETADAAITEICKVLATKDWHRRHDNLMRIDENLKRDYPLFKLRIEKSDVKDFSYKTQNEIYTILVPRDINFDLVQTREAIIEYGISLMKMQAKSYITKRIKELSEQTGLEYKGCKINSSRNKSYIGLYYCESKIVEISYHLIKSSERYIDSLLIHELCHSIVKNHGDEFYALMEKVSSKEFVKIDKNYIGYCGSFDI